MRLVRGLIHLGEEALARVAQGLLANERVAEALTTALQKGFEAKGRLDKNMQMLLGLLNLPSRADVTRLMTKLEALQGSLVNLNLKVDRLLAGRPAPRGRPRQKRPPTGEAGA